MPLAAGRPGRRRAPRLLKVGEGARCLPGTRLDGRERREEPHLEVGLDAEAATNLLKKRREDAARIDLVVGLVEAVREPIPRQGRIGLTAGVRVDARRLGRRSDGLLAAIHPCGGFGEPAKEVDPRRVIGRVGEEGLVAVGSGLPVSLRQAHVDLESRPGWMALVDEVAGRQAEPLGEIAQSDHRWPRDPGLERADVRLGVAIARELLLRQAGSVARLADALTDVVRKRTILIGRGARAGLRAGHGGSLHGLASLT